MSVFAISYLRDHDISADVPPVSTHTGIRGSSSPREEGSTEADSRAGKQYVSNCWQVVGKCQWIVATGNADQEIRKVRSHGKIARCHLACATFQSFRPCKKFRTPGVAWHGERTSSRHGREKENHHAITHHAAAGRSRETDPVTPPIHYSRRSGAEDFLERRLWRPRNGE